MYSGTAPCETRPHGPLYQVLAYQVSRSYTQYMPS